MTNDRAPVREQPLVAGATDTTSWDVARERLANPEYQRTSWLATTRPDGRPHLMPVIGTWIDDGLYVVAGEGTQKGRNLAANDRCVIATTSTTLPSLDIVLEGRAVPVADEAEVERLATAFRSSGWPLEPDGDKVRGPHGPTAGPPPYRIYRIVPSKGFGLPGMHGMDKFDQSELPRPTRWEFANG
jgi:hypothetical protein